jgi:uncharacterized protein YjbJ (UPF0337 family)
LFWPIREFDQAQLRGPAQDCVGTGSAKTAFDQHSWDNIAATFTPPGKGAISMNWDRIEGNWKQFRGRVQQQWGKLTNDDLDTVEGRRTELVGKIQERYGIAKDEAEKQVDSWMRKM